MADFGENPDQGKFWNEASGLSWVENDSLMSERLETISQLLLENLDLHPSSKMLDIGCGGGTTALALAKRAPPSVQITGLDISKPLLDLAAQKCADHENINFVLADAQAHRFAVQNLDTVISRFGVMFFENPVKAFQNIKSALRVAGRLRFVCWAPLEENEFFYAPLQAVLQHTDQPFIAPGRAPGPLAFSDAAYLRSLLEKAGFQQIEIAKTPTEVTTKDSPEEDAKLLMQIGFAERIMTAAEMGEAERAQVFRSMLVQSAARQKNGKISYGATVYIVTARA
ncbi:methyltransferase domain-containing protein [Rhodobacteraceae bacterium IMCC15231]|nr:methyltransferase domain-containing protein [Rhodobacteraceae bacterium IMCC15231]